MQRTDSARDLARMAGKPLIVVAALTLALLSAFALAALALPATSEAKKAGKKAAPRVTVMTRNLHLGADLNPAIEAASIQEAIKGAGEVWRELESTKFPERAGALAREIRRAKPDLVGLQEVATWYKQEPSDGGWTESGGIGEPATDVHQDFLAILMRRLNRAKGPKYRVVVVQEQFQGELPVDADDDTSTGTGPLAGFGGDFDARLVMHDAILVKRGSKVRLGKRRSGQYREKFIAELAPGVEIDVDRGWVSAEARVRTRRKGKRARVDRFRFVNTHLESFGDPRIREAQARELIAGPLATAKRVILVGDINSGRTDRHNVGLPRLGHDPNDPLAFLALQQAGFRDNGAVRLKGRYPQTCCYPADGMRDPTLKFTHTVDHVLTRPGLPGLRTLRAFVTGNDPDLMTPSGLWPSDHGGKVSVLQLRHR